MRYVKRRKVRVGVKVLRNCKADLFLDPELRVKKNIIYLITTQYIIQ